MKHLICIALLAFTFANAQAQYLNGMVNPSSKVISYNQACGCLTLSTSQPFSSGDRVLIIQMQGAAVSTENTDSYGYPTNLSNCGKFEFNSVVSISGNVITLAFNLLHSYDFQNGSVQLVKVATGTDISLGNISTKKWDGSTGGVIVVEASNSININGVIDASGCGFRGATSTLGSYNCGAHDYSYNANSTQGAAKGEGVSVNALSLRGRGAWSNGGGGGNNHNAGGGGGSNASIGGVGGFAWGNCAVRNDSATRGLGGFALNVASTDLRAYLGGGGGAGHRNDANPSAGANGGGIIILIANTISMSSGAILNRGADAQRCEMDGAGGGGAGGTVVMLCENFNNRIAVDVRGGNGGDARFPHGPGGGGSAGVLYLRQDRVPTELQLMNNGGNSGMHYELGAAAVGFVATSYGAANGESGLIMSSTRLNTSVTPTSIFSVDAGSDRNICSAQIEQLSVRLTGGEAPFQYSWTSTSGMKEQRTEKIQIQNQNSSTYYVNVRDARGCVAIDSVRINVSPSMQLAMSARTTICKGKAVILQPIIVGGSGELDIRWTPEIGLHNPNTLSTIAAPEQSTMYVLHVTDRNGCSVVDSTFINVVHQEKPRVTGDTIVCVGTEHVYTLSVDSKTQLMCSALGSSKLSMDANGKSVRVVWAREGDAQLFISGDIANSCVGSTTLNVHVISQPEVAVEALATSICEGDSALLNAGMFAKYLWSTGESTRTINVKKAGDYSVRVWNSAGCESISTAVHVEVYAAPQPVITVLGKLQPCSAEAVTLDAGDFESYEWSNGASTRTITVATSGDYSVNVTNISGCKTSSSVFRLALGKNFKPQVLGASNVCAHSVQVYKSKGATNSYFSWNVDGAADVQYLGRNNDSISVSWMAARKGRVVVIENAAGGCTGRQEMNVEISTPSKPVISSTAKEMFDDQSVTLDAGSDYDSYLWSNGKTTRSIVVNDSKSYSVTVRTSVGCEATSEPFSVRVIQRDAARVLASALRACDGTSITLSVSDGYENAEWSTGEVSNHIIVATSGRYFYTVLSPSGSSKHSDTVSVEFVMSDIPTIERNGQTLSTIEAASYQWFLDGKELQSETHRTLTPKIDGNYSVRTSNSFGCSQVSKTLGFQAVIRFFIAAARIEAGAGAKVNAGVRLNFNEQSSIHPTVSYSMVLRVNKSMLRVLNSSVRTEIDGSDLLIFLEGRTSTSITHDIQCEVLLGDTSFADIRIEQVVTSDSLDKVVENGFIHLQGACSRSTAQPLAFGNGLEIVKTYPNPSTEKVSIEYTLAESGVTTLVIVDMNGLVVKTLLDAHQNKGSYTLEASAAQIPSGKYMLVLRAPNNSVSREISVIH